MPGGNTEALKVMETLKMSMNSRMEIKEILTSGIKGWKSKMERMKQQGRMYRSASSTLTSRCNKKLTEKTPWYRKRSKKVDGK